MWKLNEEKVLARTKLTPPTTAAVCLFDPQNPSGVVHVSSDGSVKINYFDSSAGSVSELFHIRKWKSLKFSCVQFNPSSQSNHRLACGASNAQVFIFHIKDKTFKILEVAERTSPVVDIQWDKLSSVYLLVAYGSFVSLWDSDAASEIMIFDKQNQIPISGLSWIDWTAGNYITANAKSGSVRVWNASQSSSLTTIKVAHTGIHTLTVVPGATQSIVCACIDGSIVSYSLAKMQLEFSTAASPGHTNTIYEVAFCPTNADIFASCSNDGTVKTWAISKMSMLRCYSCPGDNDCGFYCVAWSVTGRKLAASTGSLLVLFSNTFGFVINRIFFNFHWDLCPLFILLYLR